MVALDIILLIILALSVFEGFKKGVVAQLGGLVGIVIGIWLAFRYSDTVGGWLRIDPEIAGYVAFVLIILVAILVIGVIGWGMGKVVNLVGLGVLNRLGGVLLSLVKSVLILGILLMAFTAINRYTHIVNASQFSRSFLYTPIVRITDYVIPYIGQAIDSLDNNG